MNTKIERLQKVEIRQVWPKEDAHFTPWLCESDNIKMIGDLIGRELQIICNEHWVGSYKADILCEDLYNKEKVVIENQYSKTDHKHLGQLITYASGVGANIVIWISETFGEEHRAALDWLNNNTNDHLEFYGIEVELYTIGSSLPAPKFNILAKPNNWSKNIRRAAESGEVSETKLLQQEYWTSMKAYADKQKFSWKMQKPSPQAWTSIAIGKSNYHLDMFANVRDKRIGVELVIQNPNAESNFKSLEYLHKEDSLNNLDSKLEWRYKEGGKQQMVSLRYHDTDPSNKSQWPEQHKLLVDTVNKFIAYFQDKIRNLDIARS